MIFILINVDTHLTFFSLYHKAKTLLKTFNTSIFFFFNLSLFFFFLQTFNTIVTRNNRVSNPNYEQTKTRTEVQGGAEGMGEDYRNGGGCMTAAWRNG